MLYDNYILKIILVRASALLLVLMVLVSSFKWSVNVHYCGSELINYAFLGEAEGCGMEEFDNVCEAPQNADSYNKTCCSNKDLVFKSDNQVRKFQPKNKTKVLQGLPRILALSNEIKINLVEQNNHYSLPPPKPVSVQLALIQVYRI